MENQTLTEFLLRYDPNGTRVAADITVPRQSNDGPDSPLIIVRYGERVLILNPMGVNDHLCIDAHPFMDGQDAVASVFGMSDGQQVDLEPFTGIPTPTSHNRNAAHLIAILLGEQGTRA